VAEFLFALPLFAEGILDRCDNTFTFFDSYCFRLSCEYFNLHEAFHLLEFTFFRVDINSGIFVDYQKIRCPFFNERIEEKACVFGYRQLADKVAGMSPFSENKLDLRYRKQVQGKVGKS